MIQHPKNKARTEQFHAIRFIKGYQKRTAGKTIKVREYKQTYVTPRGPVNRVAPDKLQRKSQTMWLMDRYGHFVGRANYEGKTNAKDVAKYGYDTTTTIRDAKRYKRIFGRTHSPKTQTRSIR